MTTKATEPKAPEVSLASEPEAYQESLKFAAYATNNGHKTLLIADLIQEFGVENVGIINCEHGLGTIKSLLDQRYIKEATNLEELRTAWGWANEHFKGRDKWVVVDGGSRALNWINHAIFRGAQGALEGMLDGTQRTALDPAVRKYASYISKDMDMNSQQMWWRTGYECEQLLDAFVRIGSNMYWTFWEDQTSISQYVKGVPWIPDTPGKGALAAVKGAFDFIFRLIPDGDKTIAYFRNPPGNQANYTKTRDDWHGGYKVPDVDTDFNLGKFARTLMTTKKETA